MTTSEQARAWAKAEAEKRYPDDGEFITDAANAAFQQGILHVLSLLESDQAVEAVCAVIDPNALEVDMYPEPKATARAALAAAVAAITNQETGESR